MNIEKYNIKMFEDIKHIDEHGNEYWEARELELVLEYAEWRKFNNTIQRAITTCNKSEFIVEDHFVRADKMVSLGSGSQRKTSNL